MDNLNQQGITQLVCLIIKTPVPSDIFIRYDINNNYVHGIKDFLMEMPLTCFITNFDLMLEKNNKLLDDNESIFDLGLENYEVILIVPKLYCIKSIKEHIARLKHIIFDHCPVFNINGPIYPYLVSKDKEKLITKAKDYYEKIHEIKEKITNEIDNQSKIKDEENEKNQHQSTLDKDKDNTTRPKEEKTIEEQNKEKEKQDESFLKDCIEELTKSYQKIEETDFLTFRYQTYPQSALYENMCLNKQKKYILLHSILESISNQLPSISQSSDLLYIEIATLEDKTIYITCDEKGFYINNTIMNNGLLYIDNSPSKNPLSSFTLVHLLSKASIQFKERFTQLITQIIDSEPMLSLPSPNERNLWLKSANVASSNNDEDYYLYTFKSVNSIIKSNPLNKEWNEEFQAFLDINFTQDPIQNLTKEKLLNEFYQLFKQTAVEGIELIRHKKIEPFSFFENPKRNEFYYMHANIIFTILEDSYLTNRTFTKDDLKQTSLGANLDLKHLNYLNINRYNFNLKFYLPLNCVIQYKGMKCHCQVITPGVLFNSDNLVDYGEGEQGVMKYNEDFHSAFGDLAEKLNIRQIRINDSKREVPFYGNPEIKGVNGVDKRKYLFDLIHLFPRDLNYPDEENDAGCLLRPELIREYKLKLFNKTLTDEIKKDIDQYKQYCSDINNLTKFDTCIGVKTKKLIIHNDEYEKDEKQLKELALFLKEEMIDMFILNIMKEIENENAPNDYKSLTEYLHRYGINCRYLGVIYNRMKEKNWLSTLIGREIIRRSVKHIMNEMIQSAPDYLIKCICCHLLNILLAPGELIRKLEGKTISVDDNNEIYIVTALQMNEKQNDNSNQSNNNSTENKPEIPNQKGKKKKKNKKKKNNNNTNANTNSSESNYNAVNELKEILNEIIDNKQLSNTYSSNKIQLISPSEFYKKLSEIAKIHFSFDITFHSPSYINSSINKHGLLRDLCKSIGIQLEAHDYELYNSPLVQRKFDYSIFPFKPRHICGFYSVVKDYVLPSELHRPLYEQAEVYSKEGLIAEASEKYKQLIYTCNEIYGIINDYSALTYKKLGEISFFEKDYLNGINYLHKAITIYEKLYDFDCSEIINTYALLATFNHFLNNHYNAFVYISRSIEIANYTYPRNHPGLITKFISIGMYFIEQNMIDKARLIVDKTMRLCQDYYLKNDQNLQRPWLLISQLSIKAVMLSEAIYSYSNYIELLKLKQCSKEIIQNGEIILNELKLFEAEVKKHANEMKIKREARAVYEELMRSKLSEGFWDDIEKPMSKILADMQELNARK